MTLLFDFDCTSQSTSICVCCKTRTAITKKNPLRSSDIYRHTPTFYECSDVCMRMRSNARPRFGQIAEVPYKPIQGRAFSLSAFQPFIAYVLPSLSRQGRKKGKKRTDSVTLLSYMQRYKCKFINGVYMWHRYAHTYGIKASKQNYLPLNHKKKYFLTHFRKISTNSACVIGSS